jgi:Fur family transcriptional regulator, peroxide stress response regulator
MKRLIKQEGMARLKRTPQRLAIMEYLDGNTSHPSAEEIYQAVSETHQAMSFATVYNTLNALTQSGVLRELTIDPTRRRYDPDTSDHNHLICVLCGKIVDVPGPIEVEPPEDLAHDYTLLGSHIEFYGECHHCRKKKKAS